MLIVEQVVRRRTFRITTVYLFNCNLRPVRVIYSGIDCSVRAKSAVHYNMLRQQIFYLILTD